MNRNIKSFTMAVFFTVMLFTSFSSFAEVKFHQGENLIPFTTPREEIFNALEGLDYSIVWENPTIRVIIASQEKDAVSITAPIPKKTEASAVPVLTYEKPTTLPRVYQGLQPGLVNQVTLAKETLQEIEKGKSARFDLPNGSFIATHDNTMTWENGDETWIGYSKENGKGYRAIITIGENEIVGSVNTPTASYKLETFEGKTYLIDVTNLEQPGNGNLDRVLPDGRMINAEVISGTSQSFTLYAPYVGKARTVETITWTYTSIDPNLPVVLSFQVNNGAWTKIGTAKVGGAAFSWKPKDTAVTENGVVRACVQTTCSYANVIIKNYKTATWTSGDVQAPSVPTWQNPVGRAGNSFGLLWNPSTDNTMVMGYNLYVNGAFYKSLTTTGFNFVGKKGQTYRFRVEAYDTSGNKSAWSDELALTAPIIVTKADLQPPSQPMRFVASLKNVTTVSLSWTVASDDKGLKAYRLYRNGQFIVSLNKTSYTDMNLARGVDYTYALESADKAGNRSVQNVAVISTPALPPPPDKQAPSVPNGLACTALSSVAIKCNWTASTDNVGVAGYEVKRNGGLVGQTADVSIMDTGLTANTTYAYTVLAYDAAGNRSAPSSAVSVKTLMNDPNAVRTVDIMIVRPPSISDTVINYLMSLTNQAYIDSGVHLTARLVYVETTSYVPTTNAQTLDDLSKGVGALSNIAALRAQYGADIVSFVRLADSPDKTSCGLGYLNGANGTPLNVGSSMNVSMYGKFVDNPMYFCTDTTFTHEAGHNMGLMHDRATASGSTHTGRYPYSYGFCKSGVAGDIMSYCSPLVRFFSSPDITVTGKDGSLVVLGVPYDQPDSADNVRSLNNSLDEIANLMPTKVQ